MSAPVPARRVRVRLAFVPQDLWVGAYWDGDRKRLYVCVVPCLPLIVSFTVPCPTCQGSGRVDPKIPHWICGGTGRVFP